MSTAIETTRAVGLGDDSPDGSGRRSEGKPFEFPSTFP